MMRIPNITRNLLIINVLAYAVVWILELTTAKSAVPVDLNDTFGLHFFMASDFRFYQLVTYMFMHGSLMHLFFNMFALWMFGCVIENVLGARRFLFYYILCGIGAGLFQEAAQFVNYALEGYAAYDMVNLGGKMVPMDTLLNLWTTVGASGAVYAILLAFGMLFPEQRIFIFPLPVPIKAKWLIFFYVAIELYFVLSSSNDGVAHIAHLGGMVFGFFLIRYWRKHPTPGYTAWKGKRIFEGFARKKKEQRKNDPDWDYNARRKAEQEAIDAILDKVRKSGYDSLTREEKQRLFDQSRNK